MTSQEYCKIAVAALEDRKAEDVKIIDIREISPVADYFVIADGTNQNQIQAMRDACEEALYKAGLKTKQIEGNSSSIFFPRKIVYSMIWSVSGETERSQMWLICKIPEKWKGHRCGDP